MGNKQSNAYESINGCCIRDLKTQDEILYEKGVPCRIESFTTGFRMRDPIVEDKFIVEYGKYIYERFVYENEIVYFLRYKNEKYAWKIPPDPKKQRRESRGGYGTRPLQTHLIPQQPLRPRGEVGRARAAQRRQGSAVRATRAQPQRRLDDGDAVERTARQFVDFFVAVVVVVVMRAPAGTRQPVTPPLLASLRPWRGTLMRARSAGVS